MPHYEALIVDHLAGKVDPVPSAGNEIDGLPKIFPGIDPMQMQGHKIVVAAHCGDIVQAGEIFMLHWDENELIEIDGSRARSVRCDQAVL